MVTFKIKGKNYHVFRFGKRTIFVLNSNLKNFEKTKRNKMFIVNSIGNYYYVPSTVSPKKKKKSASNRRTASSSSAAASARRRTPRNNRNENESLRLFNEQMRKYQELLNKRFKKNH